MQEKRQQQGRIYVDAFWVMTANVAGQDWMGWHERKKISASIFERIPCHLVGFQEFGVNTWEVLGPVREDLKLIPGLVAGELNINAIAYNFDRFEPLSSGTFWLSDDGTYKKAWDGSERGASWATLHDKHRDRDLMLVNVHLDNKSPEAQTKGTELVLKFIAQQEPHLPVIITADSNVSVDSRHVRWQDPKMRQPYELMKKAGFEDVWVETHKGDPKRPFTYHGFQGEDYSLDEWGTYDTEWIMTRGLKPLNCVLIRDSIGGIWPSDHYWMMALVNYT